MYTIYYYIILYIYYHYVIIEQCCSADRLFPRNGALVYGSKTTRVKFHGRIRKPIFPGKYTPTLLGISVVPLGVNIAGTSVRFDSSVPAKYRHNFPRVGSARP